MKYYSEMTDKVYETKEEWEALITAYKGLSGGKRMWFETIIPSFEDAFFVVAQPPEQIPQPEFAQNGLLTVDFNLTIEEYKGMDTKVAFTPAGEQATH